MPKSDTHNEIVLRPPPGSRFTIWGSDVHLEFQRGREREIVSWLRSWIDAYIEPEALKAEAIAEAKSDAKAEKEMIELQKSLQFNSMNNQSKPKTE